MSSFEKGRPWLGPSGSSNQPPPPQLSPLNESLNVRRAHLHDKPLRLPGYLAEPAACAAPARLGRR